MMSKTLKTFALLSVLLLLAGCSVFRANYGDIVLDPTVEKQFEEYKFDPDMKYYFSGSEAYPTVVMGLKKAYVLDNDLWKPIKHNPEAFKETISYMQSKAKEYLLSLRGFVIKDPQGKAIGVWYSLISIRPMIVKMGEGNKVVVFTPEPFVYPSGPIGGAAGTPVSPTR